MTDQEHADDIRAHAKSLRDSIAAARLDGLEVHIPLMLMQWLESGHPPGEPEMWTIKRRSL